MLALGRRLGEGIELGVGRLVHVEATDVGRYLVLVALVGGSNEV